MQVVGLILAGGLLLLWVAWKMYRELRHAGESGGSHEIDGDEHSGLRPAKSFAGAAWAVALADVSMSLDNVLAVAGAAREHPGILIIGLFLSVALMGLAANIIARYIERYRWIAWLGLIVILWVAGRMIYDGIVDHEVGVLQLRLAAARRGDLGSGEASGYGPAPRQTAQPTNSAKKASVRLSASWPPPRCAACPFRRRSRDPRRDNRGS